MPNRTREPGPGARALLCILLVVTAVGPAALAAQVNIEALRRDDPPLGRSGSFGGDLTIRTGNVDFVQVGLNGRHTNVGQGYTTLMVGNGGIGLLGRSRFASSGLFHYRRTYHVSDWVSPELYGQVNYDRAQLLLFRAVTGAGVRTGVAEGAWGHFGAGTSMMIEHERLELPDTASHSSETTVLRTSTFLTLRLVPGEQLVVTSTTYVQPRIGALGDVRVLENMRLATSITQALALTVSFDMRFDSRPPDAIARLDTTLRTGVTYTY